MHLGMVEKIPKTGSISAENLAAAVGFEKSLTGYRIK